MVTQARWHGEPISSGFYDAFLAQGGHRSSYFLSKYLKSVLVNIIMISILCILIRAQKFQLEGIAPIYIFYILVGPFFVIGTSTLITLVAKLPY